MAPRRPLILHPGVVIRWVDEAYDVYEDLIGLSQAPKTDSNTLTNGLKDILVCCILPLSQCRGQAYDGGIKYVRPST